MFEVQLRSLTRGPRLLQCRPSPRNLLPRPCRTLQYTASLRNYRGFATAAGEEEQVIAKRTDVKKPFYVTTPIFYVNAGMNPYDSSLL